MSGMIISPTGTSPIIISPTGTNRIISSGGDEPLTGVWWYPEVSTNGDPIINYTEAASNNTANDVPGPRYFDSDGFGIDINYLYLGFSEPFNAVKIKVGTAVSRPLSWEYHIGGGNHTQVSNLQQTVTGLTSLATTTEGIVYWNMPTGWVPSYLNGSSSPVATEPFLYWLRIIEVNNGTSGNVSQITRILKTTPP